MLYEVITLKKNDLKASRTKIAISWTLDQHAMRGDKIEMLQNLTSRLRDRITSYNVCYTKLLRGNLVHDVIYKKIII